MKRRDDDQQIKRSTKPRNNEENTNTEDAYRGRPARGARGRGRGDYNPEFRGRGGGNPEYRGRGAPRGEFRGNPRGRGGRGAAPFRESRGGYNHQRDREVHYQSNDEEISDGPEPLTQNEIAFIEERVAENKDKLAGIVTVSEN
jgi:hypothetical protein